MRLALEEDSRLTDEIPALRLDHIAILGRKHIRIRQRFLCRLLATSYERRRPHANDPRADSFSSQFLRKGLRVSNRKDAVWPFLMGLYSFQEGNHGYDSKKGLTKAYRLDQSVGEVLDTIYSSSDPLPIDSGATKWPGGLPSSGLPREVSDQGIHVPGGIQVPIQHLDEAIARVQGWIGSAFGWLPLDPDRPEGMDLESALRILKGCRKWVISAGGLPNQYRLQASGRLGPAQGQGGLHVITLPRTIRHLIFHRSGLEDYDLVSCHWSILRSLAKAQGISTPLVDSYVSSKAEWHARWSKLTDHPRPAAFKSIAASWLTGGTLSAYPATAGAQAVGSEVMARLVADKHAQRLHKEVTTTLPRVLGPAARPRTTDGITCLVNMVGQPSPPEEPGSGLGRLYAHLLTGLEQLAMRAACRKAHGVQAVVYDGFIAPPQDVAPLEEAIQEESSRILGFPLELKLKREAFSRAIEDREPDPWDF